MFSQISKLINMVKAKAMSARMKTATTTITITTQQII